ncbi:nuclear receptor subfamily 0 group B member 2-like [Microcaecilia unicolor]|uniref:Nuclear receptor subfamily 0 group B member 2-like n=1 Tax=Microcaecilia unicolor TaxID=1415580 RepID=A0A6P7XG97_9AMPH|nr:nuclear receptor subfamily 0 group B member 2-like [Microcaecilia unicolor]
MAAEAPSGEFGKCQCQTEPIDSILYQILNRELSSEKWECYNYSQYHRHRVHPWVSSSTGCCPCGENRKVVLKTPEVTCRRASEVLLKTVAFIRNLPSFYQLPHEDQALLIRQSWVPLFVLGLAQEQVDFDLQELLAPSLLKKILLNQSDVDGGEPCGSALGAPLAEVRQLKCFLGKLWNLDMCAKEYAYLKGIILFNPEICGLRFPHYVQTLQQEAWRMLTELNLSMYSRNQARFNWILGAFTNLQAINVYTITELFIKPILGEISLDELLLETLSIK